MKKKEGNGGADQAPVQFCPEKGCGKKMSAFKRGDGWVYICPDAPQHDRDRVAAKQRQGTANKGGVKKGTRSPLKGRKKKKK